MPEHQTTSREQWLEHAVSATRTYIEAERAENAYDLVHAAPGSTDYAIATDSHALLRFSDATLLALEAELAERRRHAERSR